MDKIDELRSMPLHQIRAQLQKHVALPRLLVLATVLCQMSRISLQ